MTLQDIIYTLDQIGFTEVFLPFILIFTIIFALLQKIKIFGEGSKKFNAVISMALAVGAIIPHTLGRYPANADIVVILNNALPNVSLLIVAIVFLLVLISTFGGETNWTSEWMGGFITILALAAIVVIFGNAAGWWEMTGLWSSLTDPNIQATLIIVAVFWIIMVTITREETDKGFFHDLGTFFKKSPPKTP